MNTSFPVVQRHVVRLALALLLAVGCTVHAHEYPNRFFKLIHPWAEPTEQGATTAKVYFSLEDVQVGDRLVGATTPYAEAVELRAGNDAAAGDIAFEPAEAIAYVPGQAHLLLRGLKQPLQLGRSYLLTMNFEKAGPILVMVSVGAH